MMDRPEYLLAESTAVADGQVFTARCEARALLWREGELPWHEAVDVLQRASTAVYGLDVETAQHIMATAFGAVRQ